MRQEQASLEAQRPSQQSRNKRNSKAAAATAAFKDTYEAAKTATGSRYATRAAAAEVTTATEATWSVSQGDAGRGVLCAPPLDIWKVKILFLSLFFWLQFRIFPLQVCVNGTAQKNLQEANGQQL